MLCRSHVVARRLGTLIERVALLKELLSIVECLLKVMVYAKKERKNMIESLTLLSIKYCRMPSQGPCVDKLAVVQRFS